MIKKYFWNIIVALDQLCNAFLLGDPRETMSSRMGKHIARRECVFCKAICNLLDLIQIRHCQRSIEPNVGDRAIIE